MAKERLLAVREGIRAGREPFDEIMQAIAELAPDEDLVLLAPFEPVPLYGVLAGKGFGHATEAIGQGDYRVRFARSADR